MSSPATPPPSHSAPRLKAKFSAAPWSIVGAALIPLAATTWWLLRAKTRLGLNDWYLEPDTAWPLAAWLLPLLVLLLLGGLAALSAYDRFKRAKSAREQRASTRLSVAALTLLALLWPWTLQGPGTPPTSNIPGRTGGFNLVSTLWSDVSSEYFSVAYQVESPRDFARTYADQRQQPPSRLQAHVATHPPGAVLFFYGARKLYEALPPLQTLFGGLGRSIGNSDETEVSILSRLATERTTATRSAGTRGAETPDPFPLPPSALGGALWCAFLLALAVALTVPAVFALASGDSPAHDDAGRAQADGRGLLGAALWALCPSALLFAFTLDTLIACLGAWSLVCFARRLRGTKPAWGVLAGVLWGLTTFLSFGAGAMGAIFFIAVGLRRRARPFYELALLLAGFVALWLVMLVLFPAPITRIYSQAMEVHHTSTLVIRSRWGWAWLNLLVFAAFAGWPLVMLVLAEFGRRLVRRSQKEPDLVTNSPATATSPPEARPAVEDREDAAARVETSWRAPSLVLSWSAGEALGIATLVTILLLTLSGSVRGEVERLWVFLLPPLCAWAGLSAPRRLTPVWCVLLALQAWQVLALAATLMPLIRPY